MRNEARLIIDSSEKNSDLLYRTGFFVPDPVIYLEHKGVKILVLNDLEYQRGLREARVDQVVSYSKYRSKLSSSKRKKVSHVDIVDLLLKERKIRSVLVQRDFPVLYADVLRKKGLRVKPVKEPFLFMERLKKTPQEIKYIKKALRVTAAAMEVAIGIIEQSEIVDSFLYYDKEVLTSERIKSEINVHLVRNGYLASHTIVSCAEHSSLPHHTGSGPLRANSPIIIDIFPRSQENGYFGDMTRTVVKGRPSPRLAKMYNVVVRGQNIALSKIRHGARVRDIHLAVIKYFEAEGFKTEDKNGKPQGFIHSTGHGLGLDIHEPPRIGDSDAVLEEGNVVTVEPGLYYEDLGGIRVEDVVVVTKEGFKKLSRFRKKFKV